MIHPPGSCGAITLIGTAGEVRLELLEGAPAAFGPDHWIDTRAVQTRTMESFVPRAWVTLSRHGAEMFEDAAKTIERIWPRGVASAGAWRASSRE